MIPGAFQLEGASELELRLHHALIYVETQLGCGEEQTALAVVLSDSVRQLQGFRKALEAIVDDASMTTTACHQMVHEQYIEEAATLLGR